VTRRDEKDQPPRGKVGHAADRRRQFEEERGLNGPRELDPERMADGDTAIPGAPEQNEPPAGADNADIDGDADPRSGPRGSLTGPGTEQGGGR
jgi:hypothetical protein